MKRAHAVAQVAQAIGRDALTVACNGMIGRELYTHGDRPGQFYMIGSMGLAASIALGVALARPERPVVVFDGDGNVLMNMGALGSVAAAGASNFYHVVFDNHAHGSTGDQRTIADVVPLEQVARAAGYTRVTRAATPAALEEALTTFFSGAGPAMLLVEVERGNVPGIKRVEIEPPALAERFRTEATREVRCEPSY